MAQVNLGQMFLARAQELADRTAIKYKEGKGEYQSMGWREFASFVEQLAFGLAALDIGPGSSVGIFSPTSHLWIVADLATICNGAFSVPLYPNSSVADVAHILNNSEAEAVFVSGEPLLAKVLEVKSQLGALRKIIYWTPLSGGKSVQEIREKNGLTVDQLIGLSELQALGQPLATENPNLISQRAKKVQPEDIATVIYTSGTTGTPKGVSISHQNIISLLVTLPKQLPLFVTDTYLSYLPLSHVFERVCGEYYWLYAGGVNAFAESIETMAKNLNEIKPTYLLAVPRVLDRIYAKVRSGIDGASGRAKQLIDWAIGVGVEVLRLQGEGKSIRPTLKMKHWLAEKLVFRKLRERIGPQIRFIIVGGAPATSHVLEFFNAIGICALEGYGLTETTAPTNVNRKGRIKTGTVGPVMDTVEMKLAEDGEILVRGSSIFKGYYKDEKATRECFEDGWFKTGDIGVMDQDGYLRITDRKKDLIINSSGKNIAPQRIEAILRTIPGVSQAIVFGDKRKSLVALITLEEQVALEIGREKGWNAETLEHLVEMKELSIWLKKEISLRSSKLAEYEVVKNFVVLKKDLAIDSGELTATLKVKRNVVAEKYKGHIDALYKDDAAGAGSGSEANSVSSKR
jgi:long-chain acyl-CoA synthetase